MKWFAWYPVKLTVTQEWAWLTTVYRVRRDDGEYDYYLSPPW